MEELYRNIKKLRKTHHWTQEELAKRVGYKDRSAISRVENGEVDLSYSMLVKFLTVFGVSPCELMGGQDQEKKEEGNE